MKIRQLRVTAVAIAVLSLSALSAEAKPWKHRQYDRPQDQQYSQRRDSRYRDRDEDRYSNRRNDRQFGDRYSNRRQDWRNNTWNSGNGWGSGRRSRAVYYNPGSYYSSLPSGCRRVVVRQATYYTPDNNNFFTYSPARNLYIVVNNPFRFF